MDFKSLKKSGNNTERLTKALEAQSQKSTFANDDEGYWKPKVGKDGNGFAEIRFLPASPQDGEEGLPWVKYFSYSFQGPGGWYINRSLVSLGQPDPAAEQYYKFKNAGQEAQAKKISRKLNVVSNILVITDKQQPECEGKVFKYRYGSKIFSKITDKMNPEFEGEDAIDPFDFWAGCNFKLKIKTITEGKNKYPNYDNSEWAPQSALFGGDDKKLEALWRSQPSLNEVMDPKNFKTYDELSKTLIKALGLFGGTVNTVTTEETTETVSRVARPKTPVVEETVDVPWHTPDEEDSDTMAYFQKLADNED